MTDNSQNGGAVLTFDMHAGFEQASAWRANVFPPSFNMSLLDILQKYNAKATFMVNNFHAVAGDENWISLLNDIHAQGHEIGCHTLTHAEWGAAKDPNNPDGPTWNNPWNYYSEQVYMNYLWYNYIRQSRGLSWPTKPRTFAYPYEKSGAAIDNVLLNVFSHLRGCPSNSCFNTGSMGPMPLGTVQSTGTIAGAWLDKGAIGINGIWNLYSNVWLPRVFNNNEYLTFAAHIPDWSNNQFTSSPWFMDYFLNFVNQRAPGKFLTMSELPSNFGTAMDIETMDIAEHIFPDGEPDGLYSHVAC